MFLFCIDYTQRESCMEKEKLVIIANPCSGKGKAKRIAPKVLKEFLSAGLDAGLMFTEKRGDAERFAFETDADIVVAIGGDGTLNETISGVIKNPKKNISLGYIPMGSTNDFARSMGLPTKWKKGVEVITAGNNKKIDICKFNERYFSYVAAYGMFAETSCSVSQRLKNKIGHLAYILLGVKEVFRKNNYPVKIEVDGKLIEDTYAFVGFGNTKSIGGILKFKDEYVEMSDGLFEVLLVKYPKSLWQLSRMIKRFNKSEWQGDGLELIHAQKVKLYVDKQMLWSLDGEKYVLNEDSEIEIIPHAIQIRVK